VRRCAAATQTWLHLTFALAGGSQLLNLPVLGLGPSSAFQPRCRGLRCAHSQLRRAARHPLPLSHAAAAPTPPPPRPGRRALGTVLLVAVPPLLVAYLRGLSPLPEERRLDALPGDVASGGFCRRLRRGKGVRRAPCSSACLAAMTGLSGLAGARVDSALQPAGCRARLAAPRMAQRLSFELSRRQPRPRPACPTPTPCRSRSLPRV
jgi:hypothetical protein